MKHIESFGNTLITLKTVETNRKISISILSRRGARLTIKQSLRRKWDRPIIPYAQPWQWENFHIVGFQPHTGRHIAHLK